MQPTPQGTQWHPHSVIAQAVANVQKKNTLNSAKGFGDLLQELVNAKEKFPQELASRFGKSVKGYIQSFERTSFKSWHEKNPDVTLQSVLDGQRTFGGIYQEVSRAATTTDKNLGHSAPGLFLLDTVWQTPAPLIGDNTLPTQVLRPASVLPDANTQPVDHVAGRPTTFSHWHPQFHADDLPNEIGSFVKLYQPLMDDDGLPEEWRAKNENYLFVLKGSVVANWMNDRQATGRSYSDFRKDPPGFHQQMPYKDAASSLQQAKTAINHLKKILSQAKVPPAFPAGTPIAPALHPAENSQVLWQGSVYGVDRHGDVVVPNGQDGWLASGPRGVRTLFVGQDKRLYALTGVNQIVPMNAAGGFESTILVQLPRQARDIVVTDKEVRYWAYGRVVTLDRSTLNGETILPPIVATFTWQFNPDGKGEIDLTINRGAPNQRTLTLPALPQQVAPQTIQALAGGEWYATTQGGHSFLLGPNSVEWQPI
ncbi:MAG TPA: hypothetical protein VEO53_03555, partial [Candidatus Binatia bacterium]|nr:hypothetical protein [Candidatus Binatia bacterium]